MVWGSREEAVDIRETRMKAIAGVQQRDKDGSGPSKAGSRPSGGAQGEEEGTRMTLQTASILFGGLLSCSTLYNELRNYH